MGGARGEARYARKDLGVYRGKKRCAEVYAAAGVGRGGRTSDGEEREAFLFGVGGFGGRC